MSEVLLGVLAAIALGITVFGASKISAFNIPPLVRGIIGAGFAFIVELVRILGAIQITEKFVTGEPSSITVWLANLRLFNIPE